MNDERKEFMNDDNLEDKAKMTTLILCHDT